MIKDLVVNLGIPNAKDAAVSYAVSIAGVLNQTAAALSSMAPAGITRRVAGVIVKRTG